MGSIEKCSFFILIFMSQVIKKLQDGGKVTPKNLQEYNNQKAKLEEEKRKKQLEADTNSITINGKKYSKSEAKEKLINWQGTDDARGLVSSYRKRGKNVDSDYKRFLNMIDQGDIQSIDLNSKGGFDIKYNNQTAGSFDPSDKYSSDYLTNAIKRNLLNLSTIDTSVGSPEKINLDYNPKNMLLSTIWGNKFRQDTYNNMTERQRTSDVAKTLKENRNRFAEYFTDKSAFNVAGELPFGSLEEYDQFINDLESLDGDLYEKDVNGQYKLDANGNRIFDKNKSTWSFAEQLRNRKFGDFWADYIFGSGNNRQQPVSPNPLSPEQERITQENQLRSELKIPENTPLSLNLGGETYTQSKEGLRDSSGNLFSGYLWLEPYGKKANPTGYYKTGFYNRGVYVGDTNAARQLSNTDSEFRNVFFDTLNKHKTNFEGLQSIGVRIGAGNYHVLNYLNKKFPGLFVDNFEGKIEDLTSSIDSDDIRNNNALFAIYDKDYNTSSGSIFQPTKYVFMVDSNGNPRKGTLSYNDAGMQVFTDEQGNQTILRSGTSQSKYPVSVTLQELIQRGLKGTEGAIKPQATTLAQVTRGNRPTSGLGSVAMDKNGGVIKLQAGGNIMLGDNVREKTAATMGDVFNDSFGDLSDADKLDLAALALDVTGLVSTAAVGVGNVVGTTAGVGSTALSTAADIKRGDMSGWGIAGNTLLNLGMDAATLIPGLGSVAKASKVAKVAKRVAPLLRKYFTAAGAVQAGSALTKLVSGQEMTIGDWRMLASGLTPLASNARQTYAKQAFTQKTQGSSKPITVSSNKDNYTITLSESEIGKFNGLDNNGKLAFYKDKLKKQYNLSDEELGTINLNKKELLSPKSWIGTNKAKLDKSTVGRELKPEVVENLANNKYGWFKKGLLEERMFTKPGEVSLPEEKYIKLKPNTYGTIEVDKNVLNRPKLGEGKIIEALPESRQLNSFTAPAGVGEIQYKSIKDIKPVRITSESPYKSEAENLGRYSTMAEANRQKTQKSAKFASGISEQDRKRQAKAHNIEKGKREAEAKRKEKADQERRNVEETAKLGERLQRERFRQKEYQDIVNYNKQQKEAAQKATQKVEYDKQSNKTRQVSKKEAKGTKKTSKDRGERIARRSLGGVLKLAYGGPLLLAGDDFINKDVDNSFLNQMSAKEYNRAYDIKKNMVGLSSLPGLNTKYEFMKGNARPVSFNMSSQPGVTLAVSGDDYITSELAKQGREQKRQALGGNNLGITPNTTYSTKTTNGSGLTSVGELNKPNFNISYPLSTLSSIISLYSKNRANNKIFDLLNNKLKPVVLDTPQDINYNIQGNEGVRHSYYRQAGNLLNLTRTPQTSDADRQLAYNLAVNKAASEARLQGDLANEQALMQSREKAFQVNANNLARREQVAAQNRSSIINMKNQKAQLEAQKIAQNAQNSDVFLHDITEQIKQRAGERQQLNTQQELLNTQKKDFSTVAKENVNEARLQKELDSLDLNSPTYEQDRKRLMSDLMAIQQSRLNRNIGYQLLQSKGMLRQIW